MEPHTENVSVFTETHGQLIGRVKWFRSKLGYGFITTWDATTEAEVDVFIHQSNIKTKHSQYRTLKEGEYVSLNIDITDDTNQAVDVTGVHGGPLMCDNQHARSTEERHSHHNEEEHYATHDVADEEEHYATHDVAHTDSNAGTV